jgi:hypothetical protein
VESAEGDQFFTRSELLFRTVLAMTDNYKSSLALLYERREWKGIAAGSRSYGFSRKGFPIRS